MSCGRCAGLLVTAHAVDEEQLDWTGWKCVNCGDWVDAQTLAHRMGSLPDPARRHVLPVYRPAGNGNTCVGL